MRALGGIVFLMPLVLGVGAASRALDEVSIETCPFPIDPNMVEGKLLGWIVIEAGRSITHTRTWHDPDGDEATVEIVKGPEHARIVNRSKIGSYTILWTPQQPQTTSIVVRATDKPRLGQPQSATGTLLIQVLPPRRILTRSPCGGPSQ